MRPGKFPCRLPTPMHCVLLPLLVLFPVAMEARQTYPVVGTPGGAGVCNPAPNSVGISPILPAKHCDDGGGSDHCLVPTSFPFMP